MGILSTGMLVMESKVGVVKLPLVHDRVRMIERDDAIRDYCVNQHLATPSSKTRQSVRKF